MNRNWEVSFFVLIVLRCSGFTSCSAQESLLVDLETIWDAGAQTPVTRASIFPDILALGVGLASIDLFFLILRPYLVRLCMYSGITATRPQGYHMRCQESTEISCVQGQLPLHCAFSVHLAVLKSEAGHSCGLWISQSFCPGLYGGLGSLGLCLQPWALPALLTPPHPKC